MPARGRRPLPRHPEELHAGRSGGDAIDAQRHHDRLAAVRPAGDVHPLPDGAFVLLARVEQWDPPVPMDTVLSELGPSAKAKGDFDRGVVRITAHEYGTALAVAARGSSSG